VKTPTPIRRSAMYRRQLAQHATFKDDAGWQVADVYTSADSETAEMRRGVGLYDASASGKLGVRGEDLEALVTTLTGRESPPIGRAARLGLDGGAVLLCRLAADELLLLTQLADLAPIESMVTKAAETVGCAHVTDRTSAFAAVDLIGPRVSALLERLLPLDLSETAAPPLAVVQAELARVHAIVLRLGEPLPAFRIMVAREYGEFVWDSLRDAGHDLGLTLVGAAARARLDGGA
jgi:heterotetrameric sarcosine oxidase gamma subunit